MKKTLKIFFPLLVIVGVLFAMLVPVSASGGLDPVIYSFDPSNDLFSWTTVHDAWEHSSHATLNYDYPAGIVMRPLENDVSSYLRCNPCSGIYNAFALSFRFNSDINFKLSCCYDDKQFVIFDYVASSNSLALLGSFPYQLQGSIHTVILVVDFTSGIMGLVIDGNLLQYDYDDYGFRTYHYDWQCFFYLAGVSDASSVAHSFYIDKFTIMDIPPVSSVSDSLVSTDAMLRYYASGYSVGYAASYDPAYAAGYDSGYEHGWFDGKDDGEALHADDYQNGVDAGYLVGYDEAIAAHGNDYSSGYAAGQRYGEALHAADFENGYNSGVASGTNVITDTVDGVFDGLLSTLGVLNGFSIFGITLGGILSIAAIFLVLFFIFKVIRK